MSLYAECAYLLLNPAIAAYVQYVQLLPRKLMVPHGRLCRNFSVRLCFSLAPEDLMTKFVDCLVQLSNLKTLEILSVSSRAPISKALKRKYAVFPSIRELRITHACHHFIRNCPNLEHLTFTSGLDTHAPVTVHSHGKGLKRIAGVDVYCGRGVYGELVNRPFSQGDHSERYHSGWLGLPEPSGDWDCWQHPSEYSVRRIPGDICVYHVITV